MQSLRSEDAITFSFFGTAEPVAVDLLNRLLETCEIECDPNAECELMLWPRLPHPDTGNPAHGPEPDFALVGDRCIVLGEAKWGAKEDTKQGVLGDVSQMDMRRGSLSALNEKLGGGRRLVALGVVQTQTLEEESPPDTPELTTRIIECSDLRAFTRHPYAEEFASYLAWKIRLSALTSGDDREREQ